MFAIDDEGEGEGVHGFGCASRASNVRLDRFIRYGFFGGDLAFRQFANPDVFAIRPSRRKTARARNVLIGHGQVKTLVDAEYPALLEITRLADKPAKRAPDLARRAFLSAVQCHDVSFAASQ